MPENVNSEINDLTVVYTTNLTNGLAFSSYGHLILGRHKPITKNKNWTKFRDTFGRTFEPRPIRIYARNRFFFHEYNRSLLSNLKELIIKRLICNIREITVVQYGDNS